MQRTTADILKHILHNNESARNSDKELILAYFRHHGLYLTQEQEDIFFRLKSTETVRRTRQRLQELGHYPATERVKKQRERRAMVIEQNIPTTKPEKMDRLFDDNQMNDIRNILREY